MSGLFRVNRLRRCDGSVLIEVLAAMVILGLLIGPLVSGVQSAMERAETVRSQTANVSTPSRDSVVGDAWKWGTTVSSAWWRPGPILHIQLQRREGQRHVAGLWLNGWFQGEFEPDDNGNVLVRAPGWSNAAGDELVVRVRGAEGAWGPPWRLVVPAVDALLTTLGPAEGGGMVETVTHVPALANPALKLSWAEAAPATSPPSLPFLLPSPGSGTCEINLDGRTQSWVAGADRGLDVYF